MIEIDDNVNWFQQYLLSPFSQGFIKKVRLKILVIGKHLLLALPSSPSMISSSIKFTYLTSKMRQMGKAAELPGWKKICLKNLSCLSPYYTYPHGLPRQELETPRVQQKNGTG